MLLLLTLAGVAQAGPPFYVGPQEVDAEFSRITAADMAVIRSKHVLMASRSFGLCIMSGIGSLAATNPIYQLNRSPSYDVNNLGASALPTNVFDTYDFVHYLCTLNPNYGTRLAEMDDFVRNRYHDQLDAIMVEYHFADAAIFPTYQATLDAIRRDFPHIKVIYVTSGYMIDSVYHASNQASAEFGALSRAAYMGKQPLYDMGKMLGTDSTGTWQGDFLCTEFNLNYPNGDNIHPNTAFIQERLGKAMLLILYKMYCELPLRANAGTDQFVLDTDSDGSCTVTLDGSESYCQQGELVSYVWKEGSTVIATGETAQVSLPYGTHTINLVVTDDSGNTDRDDVQVITKASSIHVIYQIAASADDTQFTSTSSSVTSTTVMFPYNSGDRRSGMRWAINIPPGSTILEAKVSVCSDGRQDIQNSPNLRLNLFNYDSCPAFPATSAVWSWPVTAGSVDWITEKTTWLEGQWYDSPNIASLVQEFIDRPGYAPGKYLGLRGMGVRPVGSYGWRYAYQWDYSDHLRGAKLDILYAEPEPNHVPVAEAGPPQIIHDTDRNGSVTVTLDGSGSSDDDGTIASYVWKLGTTEIATGQTASVSLPTGLHTVTLVVTDNEGATDDDNVALRLNAPPTANAGVDQEVRADGTGVATVTLNGSGSSDTDGMLVEFFWWEGQTLVLAASGDQIRDVVLPVGVHTIRLELLDDAGGAAEDTVVITVLPMDLPDLEVEVTLDYSWVYQNTPATTQDRHQSLLTVAIVGGDVETQTYSVTLSENGGAVTHFQAGTFPVAIVPGTPLEVPVAGGRRDTTAAGTYTLTVTVSGAPLEQAAQVNIPLELRLLGDIDGDGLVNSADKLEINKKLNGLDTLAGIELRHLDLSGDGALVNAEDKLAINQVLNGLVVP
jgi:hypothetical protein